MASKTLVTPDGWRFSPDNLEQAIAKMMQEELNAGNLDRIEQASKAAKAAMERLQEEGSDAMDALVTLHTFAPSPR